uniref:Uncharacterized protein n=1 Tax=Anguilla anguilla TaxID=7936 RepID=A0A0E9WEY4_ANGAN
MHCNPGAAHPFAVATLISVKVEVPVGVQPSVYSTASQWTAVRLPIMLFTSFPGSVSVPLQD